MIKFNNENDANSTQLEGKRLRSKGVVIDGKYVIIENESGDLQRGSDEKSIIEEVEFVDEETPEEKKERERLERIAMQKQQELLQKQMQQQDKKPTQAQKYNEIKDGIKLSQNRGEPVRNQDGTERDVQKEERQQAAQQPEEKKLDVTASKFLVGANTEKLMANSENIDASKLTPEQAANLKNAVPAKTLWTGAEKGKGVDI